MQFVRPGIEGAYFADGDVKPWWRALDDPGRKQMKHLKQLMLTFPYFDRNQDSLVVHNNGIRYDRLLTTRGNDYLLVYNHTGRDMTIDLTRISGKEKSLWWFDPTDGSLQYFGNHADGILSVSPPASEGGDIVLIATDSSSNYLNPSMTSLSSSPTSDPPQDLTE